MQYIDFPGKHRRRHRGIKLPTNARDRPVPSNVPDRMDGHSVCATGGQGLPVSVTNWTITSVR